MTMHSDSGSCAGVVEGVASADMAKPSHSESLMVKNGSGADSDVTDDPSDELDDEAGVADDFASCSRPSRPNSAIMPRERSYPTTDHRTPDEDGHPTP